MHQKPTTILLAALLVLANFAVSGKAFAQASAYAEEYIPELLPQGYPSGLIADNQSSPYLF